MQSIYNFISLSSLVVKKKNEPKDIRNFDYTARSWTGKSPKQFLIDWVRKNLPKSPPPAFHKVAAGRYWRCKYVWISVIYSMLFLSRGEVH